MMRLTYWFATGLLGLGWVATGWTQTAQSLYPVALGRIACAEKAFVTIDESKKHPGRYEISMGKAHYEAIRILTESGAVKLEDKRHGIVWLQMANKSMLFNEKMGKRLATDCQNDEQKAVQKAMDALPAAAPVKP